MNPSRKQSSRSHQKATRRGGRGSTLPQKPRGGKTPPEQTLAQDVANPAPPPGVVIISPSMSSPSIRAREAIQKGGRSTATPRPDQLTSDSTVRQPGGKAGHSDLAEELAAELAPDGFQKDPAWRWLAERLRYLHNYNKEALLDLSAQVDRLEELFLADPPEALEANSVVAKLPAPYPGMPPREADLSGLLHTAGELLCSFAHDLRSGRLRDASEVSRMGVWRGCAELLRLLPDLDTGPDWQTLLKQS